MFKTLLKTLLVTMVAISSFTAQSAIIHQNLDITVTAADAGNAFGITEDFSGTIGYFEYDDADPSVVGFGFVESSAWYVTEGFDLLIDFGSLVFTQLDDVNLFILASLDAKALDAVLVDAEWNMISFFEQFVTGEDAAGLMFEAALSYGALSYGVVPEPSVLMIFALGLVAIFARQRKLFKAK